MAQEKQGTEAEEEKKKFKKKQAFYNRAFPLRSKIGDQSNYFGKALLDFWLNDTEENRGRVIETTKELYAAAKEIHMLIHSLPLAENNGIDGWVKNKDLPIGCMKTMQQSYEEKSQ